MKITDTFYTKKQLRIANIAKVLGHPARIAIIDFLLKEKSCICREIVDKLPLAQATVSQHLKELKKVGLISGTVEGVKVCYCINVTTWNEVMTYFSAFVNHATKSINEKCC